MRAAGNRGQPISRRARRLAADGRSRMLIVAGIGIGVMLGAVVTVLALRVLGASRLGAADRARAVLIADANRAAESIRREAQVDAREEAIKLRGEVGRELQ